MDRKTVSALAAVCLLVSGASPALLAQPPGAVAGRAVGTDGNPLVDLEIQLITEAEQPVATTRTDADGTFRFDDVPPGEYEAVAVAAQGTVVAQSAVFVSPGRTSRVTVHELTGFPGALVGFFPRRDLLREAVPGDAWRALQSRPGVLSDRFNVGGNESGTRPAYSILGGAFDQNSFVIDGIATHDPTALAGAPPYYSPDGISSIEVISGGGSAEYGTGGIVNIVTMSGTNRLRGGSAFDYLGGGSLTSDVQQIGGSEPDYAYNGGGSIGGPIVQDRAWYFLSGSRDRVERFNYAAFQRTLASFKNSNLFSRFTWRPFDGHFLHGTYTRSFYTNQADGASVTRAPEATWTQDARTQIFGLNYSVALTERWHLRLNTGCFCSDLDKETEGDTPSVDATGTFRNGFFNLHSERRAVQFRADAGYQLGSSGRHRLATGGGRRNFNEASRLFLPGGTLTAFQPGSTFPLAIFPGDRSWEVGTDHSWGYAEYRLAASRVSLTAGLRYDSYSGRVRNSEVASNVLRPATVSRVSYMGTSFGNAWSRAGARLQTRYDLSGDGRTSVYASWGQTLTPLSTAAVLYDHPFVLDPYRGSEGFLFSDSNGNGRWDVGESAGASAFIGNAMTSDPSFLMPVQWISPGLEGPTEDTTVAGLSLGSGRRLALDVRYIHRSFDRLTGEFDRVDGRQAIAGDYVPGLVVTGSDLSGDPFVLPTARFRPGVSASGTLLATTGATRSYDAFQVSFLTRGRENRWNVGGTFSVADSSESVADSIFFDENDLRGTFDNDGAPYGQWSPSVEKSDVFVVPDWSYRLQGRYDIQALGVDVAASVYGRQGYLRQAYVTVDPGDGIVRSIEAGGDADARYDPVTIVDVSVGRKFPLPVGRLSLDAGVLNLLNNDSVLQENVDLRSASAGQIREVVSPWAARVRLQYSF